MDDNTLRRPPDTLPITDEARRKALARLAQMLPVEKSALAPVVNVIDTSVLTLVGSQPSAVLQAGDYLCLKIEDNPASLLLSPTPTVVMGRQVLTAPETSYVDLTPFGAYPLGVSRRHAIFQFGPNAELDLIDLGSSNGTYLNGRRLTPHHPYRVSNRDLIHLGQMEMTAIFYSKDAADLLRAENAKLSPSTGGEYPTSEPH